MKIQFVAFCGYRDIYVSNTSRQGLCLHKPLYSER